MLNIRPELWLFERIASIIALALLSKANLDEFTSPARIML
jgi:hypothetical protein